MSKREDIWPLDSTIWSHAVVFSLVILEAVVILREEMLLAVRQFAMLAFEGQKVDKEARRMGTLLSNSKQLRAFSHERIEGGGKE